MARSVARLGIVVSLLASMGLALAPGGSAATAAPTLKMFTILHHSDVVRCCDDPSIFVNPGIYIASVNGAFEIDAARDALGRVTLNLVRRSSSGVQVVKKINPNGPASFFEGLPAFFHAVLKDSSGNTLVQNDSGFCPSGGFFGGGFFGGGSRSDPTGPDRPTYPFFCGSDLTKRTPWGLDQGWADQLNLFLDGTNVSDGDYTLTVSIAPTYVRQLGIDPAQASAWTSITVTTETCDPQFGCAGPHAAVRSNRGEGPGRAAAGEAQGNAGLTGNGTPNLEALPAHSFSVENNPNSDGRDYLDFGATIWNGGTGPLVLEGFRQGDQPVMNAVQFIYNNGVPGAPQNVGQLEFDTRPGHEHWHLEDVAQYDLLDATGARVVLSEKQSFCLAPTDPVDLLAPGSDWQPDRIGLFSACAGAGSIWLREVLPAGWGDTYFQGVAGQSFDITSLPNATYQIRVTTDPFHNLLETNYNDNLSVVSVKLGGTPGSRTVSLA